MADANSLILLPSHQTAQTPAAGNAKKSDKPTPKNHSFGQKLDKAKKAIVTTTNKVIANAPVKVTPQVKDVKDAPPTDEPVDSKADTSVDDTDAIDPTNETVVDASKIKLPGKSAAKALKQTAPVENPDKEKSKADNTTAVQQVVPTKTSTERPKKVVKASPTANNAVRIENPSNQKTPANQQAAAAANNGNSAHLENPDSDSADDLDSADTVAAANTQEFGSGKIVDRNLTIPANAASANQTDSSVNQQNEATALSGQADPVASADSAEVATTIDQVQTKSVTPATSHSPDVATDGSGLVAIPATQHTTGVSGKAEVAAPTPSPQVQFAEDNHPKIVTGIQGQLLPNGGTMQLQLNPASLGALQVTVHIADGVVTASFETSNDDATKLLSHSLGQLKAGLEAAGVSVEKLHVEQAPQRESKNESGGSDSKQAMQDHQKNAQQDQQRREMVQKMWRRLAGGSDPLDLVA